MFILEYVLRLDLDYQDEDKSSLLKLNVWKKLVRYVKRLNAHHELVADGEATFSNANANGNPEEQ